ncbi:hypothetical protein JCM8208_007216 [Rhodotorula glutinis]
MKRRADSQHSQPSAAKRPAPPERAPTSPTSLDHLVGALAHGSSTSQAPPVWSSHTNLVALALPSPQHPAPTLFPLDKDNDLFAALPHAPTRLAVQLTHLAGAAAAYPRVSTRLDLPLPPTFPAEWARISHLSFAPDGSQLLVAVSAGGGVDDLVTLFEQRSSCVDDWACVLQESVGRFGGARSGGGGAGLVGKRVVATRWVGEPRRWYPAPTFPDAREQAKKPLYCAPPRSAPLSGTAFVAVLSSEEILFVHLPNASTSPVPPGAPTVLPSVVCLPLRPAPAPAPPPSSPDAPSSPPAKGLTLPAVPTPPTPLPPLSSSLFPAAPGPTLGASAAPPPPSGTVETPTPQATIDALVTSLIPTLPANAALDPLSAAAPTASSGTPSAAAGSSGGKSAFQDELRLAASSSAARAGGAPGEGGLVREREVSRAAVGACRSRGGRAETVFVVAYCARAVGRRGGAGAGGASRRGSKVSGPGAVKGDLGQAPKKEGAAKVDSNGGFDDDFAMLADFTALDEAFGGGEEAAAAPKEEAPDVGGASAQELKEEKEELEAWARVLENGDEAGADEQWRVELAEVRVEMAAIDGPRLTVRPQPPLFINPAPSSSSADGDSDSTPLASDPVLTHLTFLGDVSLPHPLQLTSHSPSLASDGSEPAVDLCLLAVVAHPSHPAPSSSSPSTSSSSRWRSTLSSYALSREEAYPLSDAFHTLEGRKLDAPNAVEGEGSWAARHVVRRGVGKGEEGVLCAIEIRPGGGEWASVTGVVAEPGIGGEGVRTRVLRLSSVTLEPLDKTAVGVEDESVALTLPGAQLFSALTTSPNGALLCAIPFSTSSSSTSAPPVLAAAPLGRSDDLPHKLATRLAIGIARQGDVGDLVGRVRGLGDAEATLAVMQRAHEVLRAMVPAEAQLDGSALGLELLGVTTSLFRDVPELQERGETAEQMLELAACARALKGAEKRERGAMAGAWKPDLDAVWPVVGHCVWFCYNFLPALLTSALSSSTSPTLVLFLHPLYRGLLSSVTSTFQHLSAYLTIEGVGSEAMDLARGVVEDALAGVGGGRGLVEWAKLLAQVNSELEGGSAGSTLSPPLLASLAVPPSLEAQATATRSLILAAFPSLATDQATKGESGAPPTPPRTPLPAREWDPVRRARLPAHGRGCRSCLRCGRRTLAFDEPVVVPVVAGVSASEGRWKRFEAEWEGRCVCGGMWTRVRVEGGQ